MECKCAVFACDGNKYFVQCEKCKIGINSNQNINPESDTNKFKWYEQHILLIQDNPDFRLRIKLFCLFGYGLIYLMCYLYHFDIINWVNVRTLDLGFKIFFTLYIVVVFGYVDAITKLNQKNTRYSIKNIE